MKRIGHWFLLSFSLGLLACSSDSRNEPSPAQMCKSLATECAGFSSKRLQACQQIGTRGLSHPVDEDVCFVLYDTCIDECRFYNEFPPPDGGTDAGDAEAPDSGEVDSGRANSP